MLFHNLFYRRHAQAHTESLGGKKWLKNPGQYVFGYAEKKTSLRLRSNQSEVFVELSRSYNGINFLLGDFLLAQQFMQDSEQILWI